jgi:pyruvate/2-oxoglutarate/acetoin dehydrogenase E1 component
MRQVTFAEAIREAIHDSMKNNDNVIILGEGVDEPKGIEGTVLGLYKEFGKDRVIDLPLAENGCMGVAIGAAMAGMLPIITHQRMDFILLAMDQIINHAGKWHYMFGGRQNIPLVIKCTVGQGWGMSAQHSQSLQAFFVHSPGIKVIMPSDPYDAKGLFISCLEDPNPVIFIENYLCYKKVGDVPAGKYTIPLGKAKIRREGTDVTITSYSYLVDEALSAAEELAQPGISAEVIDLRSLYPLDEELILESVTKTGRLVIADPGWRTCGVSAEVGAIVVENIQSQLKSNIARVTFPDTPTPASGELEKLYYPRSKDIVQAVEKILFEERLETTPGLHKLPAGE